MSMMIIIIGVLIFFIVFIGALVMGAREDHAKVAPLLTEQGKDKKNIGK